MWVRVCRSCGLPIVESPCEPHLPRIKARILGVVKARPGLSAEALRSYVWGDDCNGGPENPKVLHVHIHQLNRRLQTSGLGYRVRFSDGGYRLVCANISQTSDKRVTP